MSLFSVQNNDRVRQQIQSQKDDLIKINQKIGYLAYPITYFPYFHPFFSLSFFVFCLPVSVNISLSICILEYCYIYTFIPPFSPSLSPHFCYALSNCRLLSICLFTFFMSISVTLFPFHSVVPHILYTSHTAIYAPDVKIEDSAKQLQQRQPNMRCDTMI